jgi:hypothetical protein
MPAPGVITGRSARLAGAVWGRAGPHGPARDAGARALLTSPSSVQLLQDHAAPQGLVGEVRSGVWSNGSAREAASRVQTSTNHLKSVFVM